MTTKPLCSLATGFLGIGHPHRPPYGHRGSERRPRVSDTEGVRDPTTRKEVSHGPLYRTPAPPPDPSPSNPAPNPTRAGPRRHPARGHCQADPRGRRRLLETDPLHPLADLLGLLLAS